MSSSKSCPAGYDYKVMEQGATLSMGRQQLISFIRGLFYPDILILDDSTSSSAGSGVSYSACHRETDRPENLHYYCTPSEHLFGTPTILVLSKGKVEKEFGSA